MYGGKNFNPRHREGDDYTECGLEITLEISIHVTAKVTTEVHEVDGRTMIISIHVTAKVTTFMQSAWFMIP